MPPRLRSQQNSHGMESVSKAMDSQTRKQPTTNDKVLKTKRATGPCKLGTWAEADIPQLATQGVPKTWR